MACTKVCMRILLLLLLLLLLTEDVEGKKEGGKKEGGKKEGGKKEGGKKEGGKKEGGKDKGKGKGRNPECKDVKENEEVTMSPSEVLNITCKPLSKIFDLEVKSYRNRQEKSCAGWQEKTLVQRNTCIGKGTCVNLPLSNSSLIIKGPDSCVGFHPETATVSVTCTKGLEIVKMNEIQGHVSDKEGIIASPSYPWQYPQSKGVSEVHFQSSDGFNTFSYTLYKVDLGESDKLHVAGMVHNTSRHGHVTGTRATLKLVAEGDSVGDGFILCYKWSGGPIGDVCKNLTEPAESMQACNPDRKEQGGENNGEKGTRKGRKKDRKTERKTERETERKTERETERKKERQTERKTERENGNKKKRRNGEGRKRRRNKDGETEEATKPPK